MKLLVTGASGLLGTRLCELAVKKDFEVYSVYSHHKPIHGTPLKLDITDKKTEEEIFKVTKPEAVVHAAALSDVDRCEKEKELAWKTNVEGTANIASSCQRHAIFLVYVSTDYVFDGNKGKYKETDKPTPINHYGLTKLKGEQSIKESKAQYCIARTSVIYGANPAARKVNFALWLLDKLKKNEKARIVTDQWNSPTLNTNLARMILEILDKRLTGTFHLAGATRLSRYEFAKLLAETFDLGSEYITPVSSKEISWVARRPEDSSLNVDKAYRTLRNKPLQISKALLDLRSEVESQTRISA